MFKFHQVQLHCCDAPNDTVLLHWGVSRGLGPVQHRASPPAASNPQPTQHDPGLQFEAVPTLMSAPEPRSTPDLCQSSRSRADTGCRCLNQRLLQAGPCFSAGQAAYDRACPSAHLSARTFAHALAQAKAGQGSNSGYCPAETTGKLGSATAPDKFEPDPVLYVPAWHRLQAAEVEAPAHTPSDAE